VENLQLNILLNILSFYFLSVAFTYCVSRFFFFSGNDEYEAHEIQTLWGVLWTPGLNLLFTLFLAFECVKEKMKTYRRTNNHWKRWMSYVKKLKYRMFGLEQVESTGKYRRKGIKDKII